MSRRLLSLPSVGSRWFSLALLAATVLMVPAVLAGAAGTADASSPSEQRKFSSQFQGKFDTLALATGVAVPTGAGFGETVIVAHKCAVSFFSVGNLASAGVQALAEDGSTSDFQAEVTAAVAAGDAQASWTIGAPNSPTGNKNGPSSVPVEDEFSCLTILVKINPTSDWFAGVSAHDLRAGGTWPTPGNNNSIFVDLFPFDAGTLDGEEFATSSTATNPQGTIASLRNSGKFSNNKIARLKLTLKNPALTRDVAAEEAIESIIVTWGEVVAAGGYHVMWKSGVEVFDTDGSLGRRDDVVDGKTKTHTITGLTGGIEHEVQVIAYNEAGQSSRTPTSESKDRATPISAATAGNTVLVGNTTQRIPGTERLTIGSNAEYRARSQAFTTGSDPAVLGSVTLPDFRKESNNSVVDVHIYSASGVDPDAELYTLTRPDFSSFSSGVPTDITFNAAAADTITLAINTTYFVVVESVQGEVGLAHTKDDDEDPATDEGWSIANTCRREHRDGTPNSDCERTNGNTAALIMVLNSPLEAGKPVLSISGSEAVEGTGIEFTVSLSPALGEEVTVEYSTADDSATTTDSDYTAVTASTLTFAANETEKTVTIATTTDSTDEDDESFNVVLSSPSENAQLGYVTSASGLIINNDQTTQTDGTLSSITLTGSDGATIALTPAFSQYKFLYTATANRELDSLTGVVVPSTTGTVQSIMYVGGNEDTDTTAYDAVWLLVPGDNLVKFMVTSPDGSRTKIYKIHVNKDPSTDATLESLSLVDSTTSTPVAVTLSPAFNPATTAYTATVGPAVTSVTLTGIQNHDGATISNDQGPDVTSGEATVGPWAGESVINIDLTAEDGATTKRYTVTAERILTVNFDAAAYSVDEGGSVPVSVSLDGVPGNEVRTNLSTTLQGATTADFGGVPEYVTFAGTDMVTTFDFVARTDIPSDPGESVTIGLSPNSQFPGLQTGSTDETVVSIGDIVTDQLVAVDFGQSTYSVNEGARVPITITLATAPSSLVTIPLTITAEGDATSPDYSVPSSVTFDSGDTSQTITFSATLDADTDPGESVKIELGTLPMGYAAGATTETTVNINNFSVFVNFGATSYDVNEDAANVDGEVQISVTLSPALGSDVAIGLMAAGQDGATTADYSLPTSVTFTAGQTQQTFTFTSKMDDVDDDDERVIIGFDALPAGVYVRTTAPTTVVNIADNDHPQISLGFEKGTYTVIEGQSIGLKMKLSGEPERGITITVPANLVVDNPASGNDFSGIPSDVHFAADATEAILTFAATDDSIDEDDEYVKLEPDLRLPAGVGLGANFFTIVTIIDDDDAGVSISESSLTIAEGNTDTYTVVLNSQPTANVTISIDGQVGTDVFADPSPITFTPTNWATPVTVTVTGGDDADLTNDMVSLTHNAVSTDSDYQGITIAGVTVMVEDNDTAQVMGLMVESGNAQLVVEWTAVTNATGYEVQWKSGGESYNTSGRQATIASGSTTTHTISSLNNGTEYTVRMRATRTGANNGAYSSEVLETPVMPTTEGVTVSKSALTVTEQDTTGDTYTVVLDLLPTASVTVTVGGLGSSDVTANPATLTFTTVNWDTPQTVTVTAGNDADTTDDMVSLTHSAASSDSAYEGITIAGVTVTVEDNDTAQVLGLMITPGNAQLAVEWASVANATGYEVQWKSGGESYNTSGRQATISSGSTTSHTISSLSNGTEYTVRVRATRTGANNGAYSAEVLETSVMPTAAGVTVSESALTVTEQDTTGDTYTVVLDRLPTASVTVTVGDFGGSDVTVNPATLTFTTVNWQTAKTVTVTAGNDADTADDTVSLTHSAVSLDSNYNGITISGVTVTVTDNDTATVTPPGTSGGGGFGPALVAPKFVDGFRTSRPLAVNARPGDAVGDPVAATHPNDDDVTYSLSGANANLFTVDEETGQIRLGQAVTLALGQTYTVNLTATDISGTGAIIIVDIEVAEAPTDPYDLNQNGSIEKDEVIKAVADYFAGLIGKEDVLKLISRYFDG